MSKKSTALVNREGIILRSNETKLDVATSQVETMLKVLSPYTAWFKTKVLPPVKMGEASAVVVALRELVDTAEKGRKALTAPLLEEKKEIDSAYKGFKEQAEKLDKHVSNLLVVTQAQERARLAVVAEKDAKKLEKVGATQAAADVREAAITAPVIGGSGITTFTTVSCKVVDLRALCAAIGKGELPVELVEPAQGKLNALVRSGMVPAGCERVESTDVKRTA